MENISYTVFICFAVPFALAIPFVNKKARPVVSYILIGMCVCLFISQVNGLLLGAVNESLYYFTTNITPVTEELVKAVPVFIYAAFISAERNRLVTIGFACGLGFALLENSTILIQTVMQSGDVDIIWILIRTLGAGLLHALCTAMVAVGFSFLNGQKKFVVPGTIGLMELAIVYHSIYNSLIQSDYKYIGAAIPMATYIIIVIFITGQSKRRKEAVAGDS